MAEDNSVLKLFGFELKRAKSSSENEKDKKLEKLRSVVAPVDDDGAGYITASGSHYGQYLDMDGGQAKDNHQLVMKYRGVATHPEVDAAIEDIVNESIVGSELESPVTLNLDKIEAPNKIKKDMQTEFMNICSMLKFNDLGHDIFRSFYVDGRTYHHLVVDEKNLKLGIQEIRPIDASKIRKVKEVKYKRDPQTDAKVIEGIKEFYIFQDKAGANAGVRLSPDSVSYVTSGLLDPTRKQVVSYLHKALKPINQLRMLEDSLVIYRLARAPERRIFYIDVGNMPRNKSEAYMKDIMSRYRNKLVYDANTGNLKDDRKHMSMLEDFWLPRREGGRGTEITTLPGGENLGQIDDIVYFQKRMYRSLNVPLNRLEQESQFSLGRTTEINRDEVKFQKFIDRLRKRFSMLFTGILKKQLILKGIITEQDWESWKNQIQVDFQRDNHFTELKNAEVLQERISTLDQVTQYVGEYFSREWVMKNVMMMNDDDIKQMQDQVKGENAVKDDEPDDNEQ
ncbi:portal protein [bacterium]|nr:portal protein [bacterium]